MTILVMALSVAVVATGGWRMRPRPEPRLGPRLDHRWADERAPMPDGGRLSAGRTARALVARVGTTGAVMVVLVLGLLAMGGPVPAVAAVGLIMTLPRLRAWREQRRRLDRITCAYPDFIDLLVLTIRSGCTPLQALQILLTAADDSVQPALDRVVRDVAGGLRFADAIVRLPETIGPAAQPLADALALADRHGTPLVPVLDRLADDARAQRRRNAEIAARKLPVRLSFPLVGFTLPSFVLLTIIPLMAGTFSSLRGLQP